MFLGVFRDATTDFTVDARALTQNGGDHIKTRISSPSGSCPDAVITDHGDGMYAVEYTPYEEGGFKRHHMNISRGAIPTCWLDCNSVCVQALTVWRSATMALRCPTVHSVWRSPRAAIQLVSVCTVLA